jgi:hypothetical protein
VAQPRRKTSRVSRLMIVVGARAEIAIAKAKAVGEGIAEVETRSTLLSLVEVPAVIAEVAAIAAAMMAVVK